MISRPATRQSMHFLSSSACFVSSNWFLNFSALKDAFEIPIENFILSRRYESELRASCVSFSFIFFMLRLSSSALRSLERACSTTDFSKVLTVDRFITEPRLLEETHASCWLICPWTVSSLFAESVCILSCLSSRVFKHSKVATGCKPIDEWWSLMLELLIVSPLLRGTGRFKSEPEFCTLKWLKWPPTLFRGDSLINLRVLKVLPNDFSKFLTKQSNLSPKTCWHIFETKDIFIGLRPSIHEILIWTTKSKLGKPKLTDDSAV